MNRPKMSDPGWYPTPPTTVSNNNNAPWIVAEDNNRLGELDKFGNEITEKHFKCDYLKDIDWNKNNFTEYGAFDESLAQEIWLEGDKDTTPSVCCYVTIPKKKGDDRTPLLLYFPHSGGPPCYNDPYDYSANFSKFHLENSYTVSVLFKLPTTSHQYIWAQRLKSKFLKGLLLELKSKFQDSPRFIASLSRGCNTVFDAIMFDPFWAHRIYMGAGYFIFTPTPNENKNEQVNLFHNERYDNLVAAFLKNPRLELEYFCGKDEFCLNACIPLMFYMAGRFPNRFHVFYYEKFGKRSALDPVLFRKDDSLSRFEIGLNYVLHKWSKGYKWQ